MLGMADRAAFVCADWAAALAGRFDLILCNPPYIRTGDLAGLMPEVARHEPAAALDGGADGCSAYRRILPELPAPAGPGRRGRRWNSARARTAAVAALAGGGGVRVRHLRADLAGIPRALVLRPAAGA